jgi:hypothetical protein
MALSGEIFSAVLRRLIHREMYDLRRDHSRRNRKAHEDDEGMTNRPSTFAYLVFGLGGITVEGIARPMKMAAWHGPGAKLGVQAKIRRVQAGLSFD